ncbi:MAG TPA: methyltransferase domain-containing protein [Anaerolineae bacterium]|nr:methyltransferase domain-containing protein [Anaerolineae bacterium]
MNRSSRVLEPGCGTGAVLTDCPAGFLHGLDWDRPNLRIARHTIPRANFVQANALKLPYSEGVFDACLTHYFLLWVDTLRVLAEMLRVTRPGGVIMALAEPDYGGRIDYPAELAEIGRLQAESLARQGADIQIGRKLAGLFAAAGLQRITTGVMGGEWVQKATDSDWKLEWDTFAADLAGTVEPDRLSALRQLDFAAWQRGDRILYVPTFYAIGWVPE